MDLLSSFAGTMKQLAFLDTSAIGWIHLKKAKSNSRSLLITLHAVLGSKHSQFTKTPYPPNILTCIDRADSHLDAHYLNEKKGMLRDGYDWLSEFAHPNFCSNCAAFTIDELNRRFVLQLDGEIQDRDFDLIAHLVISARLFIWLFDDSTHRLTKNL